MTFICENCNKEYKREGNLKNHLKKCTIPKNIIPEIVEKETDLPREVINEFKFYKTKKSFEKSLNKNSIINDLVYNNILLGTSLQRNGKWHHPYVEGYETIIVLTKSYSTWGKIGPYELKVKDTNIIFENYWQFCKVYKSTPNINMVRYNVPIWNAKETIFLTNNKVNNDYWEWRQKGFNHNIAVRYPVLKKNCHKCLYSIPENDKTKKLNYIQARKDIYFKEYIRSLLDQKLFKKLQKKIKNGKKLLITEIDICNPVYHKYYKETYDNLINEPLQFGILNATPDNMRTMINDTKHPAGHGFPLAMALQNIISDEQIDNLFDKK